MVFGPGRVAQLGTEASRLGATRALVVTDPYLAGESGIAARAVHSLRAAGITVAVFDGVESDPSIETIDAGAGAARAFGPDLFVGVGGGSSMDAAKAIAMVYGCGDGVLDHEGANTVKIELAPIIAVPTTAGTGSETSFAAVISDHARRRKVALVEGAFTPRVALLDPELTLGLPPRLTAATGMDAYAHAIDVLHSKRRQPFSDALAHHVLRTSHRHLRRAFEDPTDIVARGQVLAAACSMGFALSNSSYGIIHALGHPIGARFGVHHGVTVAVMSAPGMRWNMDTCAAIYGEAARAAGLAGEAGSDSTAAGALVDATEALMADLDMPRTLEAIGVDAAAVPDLSAAAAEDAGARFNLRAGAGAAELSEVYASIL